MSLSTVCSSVLGFIALSACSQFLTSQVAEAGITQGPMNFTTITSHAGFIARPGATPGTDGYGQWYWDQPATNFLFGVVPNTLGRHFGGVSFDGVRDSIGAGWQSVEAYTGIQGSGFFSASFSQDVIFYNTALDNGSPWSVTFNVDGLTNIASGTQLTAGQHNFTWSLSSGTNSLDFVQMDALFTAVPTPGGFALLGLSGLVAIRRRRTS